MQTTAYILSPDRASVLLIHRNKCPDDFDDDSRQFHGIMPYENGAMRSWSYQRI